MIQIANLIFIMVGIVVLIQGVVMIKTKNISKMNQNQMQYVKSENLNAFATASGIAVVILGTGAVLSGTINYFTQTLIGYVLLLVGFIIYSIILLKTQKKYNVNPNEKKEK